MVLLEISLQTRVAIGISAMVLLFAGFLIVFITNQRKKLQYHKNLQLMHAEQQQTLLQQNAILEQKVMERTSELSKQKETLQQTLNELKSSQLQLIQKEKMASLGELTAGIAHEIQNPLNFVLNFSDLNSELLSELQVLMKSQEIPTGIANEAFPLLNDIADNLLKIVHHGKRADGIVKSMLQHSSRQTGSLELIDINELAQEYLTLSYHGFRSKHKAFVCDLQIVLGENMGRIYMVPQDIGHILVNLFSNAFYSMNEKMSKQLEGYSPILSLQTRKEGEKVFISVRDNGMGISEKIMHKIFQPFFTTKPTGEATGLGLSLSYDIIRAHQGELKVESREGEYASFQIELNC
jgi:two-component system NtrC family sensor kinase